MMQRIGWLGYVCAPASSARMPAPHMLANNPTVRRDGQAANASGARTVLRRVAILLSPHASRMYGLFGQCTHFFGGRCKGLLQVDLARSPATAVEEPGARSYRTGVGQNRSLVRGSVKPSLGNMQPTAHPQPFRIGSRLDRREWRY